MPVTAYASGTQTAVIATEHFLSSPNVAATFTFHVDLSAMANGDILELRAYQMILSGGTPRVAFQATYEDDQSIDDEIQIFVALSNDLTDTNALRFSLKQTAGIGRAFPWKVLKYV